MSTIATEPSVLQTASLGNPAGFVAMVSAPFGAYSTVTNLVTQRATKLGCTLSYISDYTYPAYTLAKKGCSAEPELWVSLKLTIRGT